MSDQAPPSVAENLRSLLGEPQEKVTVDEIVGRKERHHGLAPVGSLLTLPVLIPMPPGVSMVLALPLLFAAPQMMIGRKDLWLPRRLACQAVDRERLEKGVERILPWVRREEGMVLPRLTV